MTGVVKLADNAVSESDFQRLLKALQDRRCILVVGPDAITTDDGEQVTEKLADFLLDRFLAGQDLGNSNLSHVVQSILDRGCKRYQITDAIREFYQADTAQTTNLCQQLAKLPFKLCLAVTHDEFMLRALQAHQRQPQKAYYSVSSDRTGTLLSPSVEEPIFYQLFGSLEDEDSMVLSEIDVHVCLKSLASGSPPLPAEIEGSLHSDQNVFLFVGFDFKQWYARPLLYSLLGETRPALRQNLRPSLVLENNGFFDHPDSGHAISFFENQHSFIFKSLQIEKLLDKLVKLNESLSDAQPEKDNKVDANPPTIFLSYRRDDIERVNLLRQQLESQGINTWQDTKNLRGGDRWDQMIERVIGNQVDYFILVQSHSLKSTRKSVVFRELHMARQCVRDMASSEKFIIPVLLDPDCAQEDVSEYHHIDLTTETGIGGLIEAIKQDWQRVSGS